MLWIPWMKCVCVCFNSMFSNEKKRKKIMQKRNVCRSSLFSLSRRILHIFTIFFFRCFVFIWLVVTPTAHTICIDFGKLHTHAHPNRAVAILLRNNHKTCFPPIGRTNRDFFFKELTALLVSFFAMINHSIPNGSMNLFFYYFLKKWWIARFV